MEVETEGMSGVLCGAGLALGPCADEAVQGEALVRVPEVNSEHVGLRSL